VFRVRHSFFDQPFRKCLFIRRIQSRRLVARGARNGIPAFALRKILRRGGKRIQPLSPLKFPPRLFNIGIQYLIWSPTIDDGNFPGTVSNHVLVDCPKPLAMVAESAFFKLFLFHT